jgi:hypothetical protein
MCAAPNIQMSCWLCKFNTSRHAMTMTQFIQANIGTMDLDTLTSEVHAALAAQHDLPTISAATIKEHIVSHTLNPTVRLGITLRNLLDLSDQVRGDLCKTDAKGENMGLDPKMIDAYIRLQSQIVNVYKSETNKMMFSGAGQHT